MNPNDILRIEETVKVSIEKYVNGHIRDIDAKLEAMKSAQVKHVETTDAYRTEVYAFMSRMEPYDKGLITVNNLRGFGRWLGYPALGAFLLWVIQKLR